MHRGKAEFAATRSGVFYEQLTKIFVMKKKVTAFGDSILKGVVLNSDASPFSKVPYVVTENKFSDECSRRLGVAVENYGKFGSTIVQGEAVIDRRLSTIAPGEYVILEYGGNDCDYNWSEIGKSPSDVHCPRTALAVFVERYSAVIDKIKAIGARPVLLSLPPLEPQRYFNYFSRLFCNVLKNNVMEWLKGVVYFIDRWHESYNLEVFKLAILKRVPVIDITSAFLGRRDYGDFMCADGIHPNERGHALIADSIVEHCNRKGVVFS